MPIYRGLPVSHHRYLDKKVRNEKNSRKRYHLSSFTFSGQTFSTHEISLTTDGADTNCDNLRAE